MARSHRFDKMWKSAGSLIACLSLYLATALLTRDRPSFYLDDFHVSSQNNTLNSTTTTIRFDLIIQNQNLLIGLYYKDPLNLTFTYYPPTVNKNAKVRPSDLAGTDATLSVGLVGVSRRILEEIEGEVTIGKHTIQGFYQGRGEVTRVGNLVVVVQDVFSWAANSGEPAKVAVLRMDLDGRLKFRSIENKKSHLVAAGMVEVNCSTGYTVQNETIHLNYTSGSDSWGFLQWVMLFPLTLLLLPVCTVVIVPCVMIIGFLFICFYSFCCAPCVAYIKWLFL